MNLEEFYENHMRRAIEYFGLRWDEKDQIKVRVVNGWFVFDYDGQSISVDMTSPI